MCRCTQDKPCRVALEELVNGSLIPECANAACGCPGVEVQLSEVVELGNFGLRLLALVKRATEVNGVQLTLVP